MAGQIENEMAGTLFPNETTKPESNGAHQPIISTTDPKVTDNAPFYDETYLSMSNDKLHQISALTLADPLQDIDTNNKFAVNKSPLCAMLFAIVFMFVGNASYFGLPKSMQFISITFFVIVLLICIGLIVYGIYFSDQSWDTFLHKTMRIGDDVYQDILLMNLGNKAGVITVFVFIYGSVSILLLELLYSNILYDASKCEDAAHKTECIAVYSTFSQSYPLGWAVFLMCWFRQVKCSSEIKKMKHVILYKYKSAKLIDERIASGFLSKWQDSKQWRSRRWLFIILFVFSVSILVWTQLSIRHGTTSIEFNKPLDYVSIVICCVFYLFDASVWTVFIGCALWITNHYEFPYAIMMGLLSPINANEADDIIAWWELRKFYIDVIGNIYGFTLELAIFCALLGDCIGAVYVVTTLNVVNTGVTILYTVGLLMTIGITFSLVANAVSFHKVQLLHAGTMNKEKIRLSRVLFYDDDQNGSRQKNEILLNIIDFVMSDIKVNSVPIHVLGVGMDQNFMLFLRATFVTFIILFLSVYFTG
eukprot:27801_1